MKVEQHFICRDCCLVKTNHIYTGYGDTIFRVPPPTCDHCGKTMESFSQEELEKTEWIFNQVFGVSPKGREK